MEWLIGIYIAIGVLRGIAVAGRNPARKPLWMSTQQNGLLWSLYFAFFVLLWPVSVRSDAK